MRDLAFHSIFVPLILFGFCSTYLSVLIWIWISLLPPTDMLYGTFGVLPFNKIVAAVTVFTLMTKQEKRDFYFDGMMTLIVLYGIVVALSYFFSEYSFDYSDGAFDKFWKELVLFFLITGTIYSQHRIYQALLVFSAGFGLLMVKEALIFILTAGGHKIAGMGVVGDNNGVALALLMTIPLTMYCAKFAQAYYSKLTLYVVAGLGTVTVIATYSRGGFVGLVVLGIMLLKGSKHKFKALLSIVVIGLILYSQMPADYLNRVNTISEATSDNSFEIRLLAWKINTLLAIQHPFLGVGLYGCIDYRNWIAQMPIARSWLFESPLILRSFAAHSIYFQALGDTGFVGLALFLTILFTCIFKLGRAERIARKDASLLWLEECARALKMSIVVYMVSGAALSLLYFEPLYIVLALSSRLDRLARQSLIAREVDIRPAQRPSVVAMKDRQLARTIASTGRRSVSL